MESVKPKKKQEPKEAVQPVRDENLDDMSFIEMINSVPLDEKSAALIRKFQEKEGRNRLHTRDYNSKKRKFGGNFP